MRLYLVRHGDALTGDLDPARPLSDEGRDQVAVLASFLAGQGLRITRVYHSGKLRARQTAEALAAAIAPGTTPDELAGLNPNDPVEELLPTLSGWTEDSLIAGHLPHLSNLATRLLTGRAMPAGMRFEAAAAACLQRNGEGGWSLLWFVDPQLLPRP
jgi:phosphohistidine phosphatase